MASDEACELFHSRYAVRYEEYLAVAAQLKTDGLLDDLGIKGVYLGVYRVAVGRRCLYHGEVACAHDRELQGTRYRGCCHGECVHIHLQLAQFLFYRNAELLFLVDDEQSQVLEFHLFACELVGADDNIYLALLYLLKNFLCGGCAACAA